MHNATNLHQCMAVGKIRGIVAVQFGLLFVIFGEFLGKTVSTAKFWPKI